MKLFLCSLGITNREALQTLFEKPLADIKVGVIKNPMDLKDEEKRIFLYGLVDKGFSDFGLNKVDIDLRKFEGKAGELQQIIDELDMLWITGGNVFYLRWLMYKINFEQILKHAIEKGLVYGGDSAGAVILGPTLKYSDAIDDVSQVEKVIYDGLNIIDFVALPHWDNEKFKDKLTEVHDNLVNDSIKVITFGDKQSIVINGNQMRIVG